MVLSRRATSGNGSPHPLVNLAGVARSKTDAHTTTWLDPPTGRVVGGRVYDDSECSTNGFKTKKSVTRFAPAKHQESGQ